MKKDLHERIKKMLTREYEGYVLVTCRPATNDGNMQVDMSYEGDPVLAAYLMDGAQRYLEEEQEENKQEVCEEPELPSLGFYS